MNKSTILDSKIIFSSSGYAMRIKLRPQNEIQDDRQNVLLSSYVLDSKLLF